MSFIGGGTDLPSFYEKQQGAVISTAINKYVYITANERFDSDTRVSYSQTEIVKNVYEVKHPLFREAMIQAGIWSGVEVTSVSDLPAGTGMGSSSSFTVGALKALLALRGFGATPRDLAHGACEIEMGILKEPIGRQDQYAAAYGGFRRYLFNADGTVETEPVLCGIDRRMNFFNHLMLFYLGGTRSASQVLRTVNSDQSHLIRIRALVNDFYTVLTGLGDLRPLGEILHEGWESKKLSADVSNPLIDEAYAKARKAGALGGKILGAGQAGFLLLFVEPRNKLFVRQDLRHFREVPFEYEPSGSRVVYEG